MSDVHDYYRILGVTRDADASEIKRAYRSLAKQHHPDQGGDPETFRLIDRAYRVLSDETRRAAYDASYVDGAALLDEVLAILTEYVVFPSEAAAVAVTLYAAATHAISRLEYATRLVIKSPVKRCGKSRLLDAVTPLVADPLMTADLSAAALVHSIDPMDPPTVILDEADVTFGRALRADEKAEHLRGLINAGFTRGRPYSRYNPSTRQVEQSPTFAMAILAGIGSMPDTIEDRAVIIVMRRKGHNDPEVIRWRTRRDPRRVRAVGERLGQWVVARSRLIGDAEPAMPDSLNDRAQDAWEALAAVADLAGGDWPARARAAAVELAADAEAEDSSLPTLLLADIRRVFGEAERMPTEQLLTDLRKIEESPWADWHGKPLDGHGLSRLLRTFSVRPKLMKFGGTTARGYERGALADAWERYLPAVPAPDEGGKRYDRYPVTPQVSELPFQGVTDPECYPPGTQAPDQAGNGVTPVTDTPRGRGWKLPESAVARILSLHLLGVSGNKIAAEAGVSKATVSRTIKAGCREHPHGRQQPEGGRA